MRIEGIWRQCDGGIIRPIIEAEVWAADGSWIPIWLLVDTGADRTVLCADDFLRLGMHATRTGQQLGGVGGVAESAIVATQIQMLREDGSAVKFRGDFAGLLSAETLDISVLGRDIMDNSSVIVDRPGNVVALAGQKHGYHIEALP